MDLLESTKLRAGPCEGIKRLTVNKGWERDGLGPEVEQAIDVDSSMAFIDVNGRQMTKEGHFDVSGERR